MARILTLYIDDSGTRHPDRKPNPDQFRDWFGLGGIMVRQEDEPTVRRLHRQLHNRWPKLKSPLHSVDIRNRANGFSWLRTLSQSDYDTFMNDLSRMLLTAPVIGHACVIDRPGYDNRYRERYGRNRWMLCKTAFAVIVERAVKMAIREQRRLRICVEKGDETSNNCIIEYYNDLKTNGMPFDADTSKDYNPLTVEQIRGTVYGLNFKRKSSPFAQFADLYLYPICRGGYDPEYYPYRLLLQSEKLIDQVLAADEQASLGIKYSCFELVRGDPEAQNIKAGANPSSNAASITETS